MRPLLVQPLDARWMLTGSAQRALDLAGRRSVLTPAELRAVGATRSQLRANLAARRWQRCGRAIVLHAGPLTNPQRWRVALINCGRGSVLTAFTALELAGLRGWEREEVHVLVPQGRRARPVPGCRVRLHHCARWPPRLVSGQRSQAIPDAAIRAAGSVRDQRVACGLLAAAVQQRVTLAGELRESLGRATKVRHRRALTLAIGDIEGGADALSEIDFVALCARAGLPTPQQQVTRRDSNGRRRYLDASWRRPDGRLVVAEVDGALHLSVRRWWEDQLRQNELVVAGAIVLRFPSVIIRADPELVARQLRAALTS